MNRAWLLGVAFLGGCSGEGGGGDDDNTDDFVVGDVDDDGTIDVTGDPDEVITGDLSTGAVIGLGWADDSTVACFPGTENENFNGNHVLFTGISKDGSSNIVIQADPDTGVDISLYVLEFASGSEQVPPDVTSSSRCEAAYDEQTGSNPGKAEAVGPLLGFGDRTMVIGVAGANGATAGAFSVGIWRMEGGLMDTGG